jgi:4-carboxymuconolactone decarboxylase
MCATKHPDDRGPERLPGAPGAPVELLALLDAHPPLRASLTSLGNALLFDGVLSPAERELLILRTAAAGRAPYVLSGHRPIGARAGLGGDEIAAICGEATAPYPNPGRAALLHSCDELLRHGALAPATRAMLADGGDPRKPLEIAAIVGFYRTIASITRTFELRPEPQR